MEILLPLFLLSGQLKSYLNFFGIELPVDLTLLLTLGLFALLTLRLYKHYKLATRQITYIGLGSLLIFYIWLIFSNFYTTSEEYSLTKTFYFLLNIVAFAIPFLYQEFKIRRYVRYFSVLTISLSVLLIPFLFFMGKVWQSDAFEGFESISGLYLSLSQFLGLLVVVHLTARESIWRSKLWDNLFAGGVLLLMLLLGARGPVLFSILVFGLYYLYNLEKVRLSIGQRNLNILLSGAVVFVFAIGLMLQFESTQTLILRSTSRFLKLIAGVFSGGLEDSSALTRIELYKDAIDGIFSDLGKTIIGHGIGSFGIETWGEDIRLYPHNMILEIWFELGFIGVLLFAGFVVYLLSKTVRLPYRHISYWLLVYFFLNLMKSSSLVDIRTEFAFFGVYVVQFFAKAQLCSGRSVSQTPAGPRSTP